MSKIDALYEAMQNAVVAGGRNTIIKADEAQTVMALVEVYRAAEPLRSPQGADESMRDYITRLFKTLTPSGINRLRAAIEKVEALE